MVKQKIYNYLPLFHLRLIKLIPLILTTIILFSLLLVGCAPKSEEERVAEQLDVVIEELNDLAWQVDNAILDKNIGAAEELLGDYVLKAREYDQLAEIYLQLTKNFKTDPAVKIIKEKIRENRTILLENIERWSTQLQSYSGAIDILNAFSIVTSEA